MSTLTLATLLIRLKADTSQMKKGIDDAKKSNDDFSKNVGRLKTAVAGAFAAVGVAAIAFAKQSIAAASDAQESYSKFQVVFGKVAGETEASLDAMGRAIGRSTHELIGYAGNLGDTLQPLGFNQKAAAELSTTLVGLAADLSSFNNMSMDEALQRLQGTLIGSHENALAFGVVINENMLKAELAANGWDELTGAQLEQAKVQARINLLMKGTLAAQGDAVRTADQYMNTTRSLEASLLDLKVVLGEELLPEMQKGAAAARDNVNAYVEYRKAVNEIREAEALGLITKLQADGAIAKMAFTSQTAADVLAEYGAMLEEVAEAERLVQQAAESADRALLNHVDQLEETWQSVDEVARAYFESLEPSGNYADALYDISDASTREALAVDEAARKVRNKAAENEAARLAEEELAAATAETNAALAAQKTAYENLTSSAFTTSLNDQVQAALNGTDATTDWTMELFNQASAMGLNGQQLALLSAATGSFTDAQIENALKTAAMQAKIESLSTALSNGEITVANAITALQNFETELDESTTAVQGTDGAALSAAERVDILAQKLTDMDGITTHATIDLTTIGIAEMEHAKGLLDAFNALSNQTYGGNPGNSTNQGSAGRQSHAVGGYTGDGDPWGVAGIVHKGEYVFSAPAVESIGLPALESMHLSGRAGGGADGMGGDNYFQVTVNGGGNPAEVERAVERGIKSALEKAGRQVNTMRRMR